MYLARIKMRCRRNCTLVQIVIFAGLLLLIVFMQHYVMNRSISAAENSTNKYSNCEVIHIGVVCTGYGHNVPFYSMLKSLFYFRNNPLHFHLIVDDVSGKILKTMFDTWTISQVNVSYYDVITFSSDMWWMRKSKHSNVTLSNLLKCIFPKAISTNIADKVIVTDARTIFTDDVRNLWNIFDDFNKEQAIGLVNYEDNDYSRIVTQQQRSYNADVILYNLKRLNVSRYTENLFRFVDDVISRVGEVINVTEGDVINAIIDRSYDLVYPIPSFWIYQLKTDYGYYNITKIKMFVSSKSNSKPTDNNDNYNKIYHEVLNYNGTLLGHRLYECAKQLEIANNLTLENDTCPEFHAVQNHQWRRLLFSRKFDYNVTEDDVTFVSQLSYDRRYILEELAALWEGPISLAVYVTDSELHYFIDFVENSRFLKNRFDIAYHVVFKDGDYYPINVLRNTALHNVVTPYVFLVDFDFVPTPNLYLVLKLYISRVKNMDNMALIVPAFETKKYIPRTKTELLQMMDRGIISPFRQKWCPQGHGPTNYQKWKVAEDTYQVEWRPRYEPYIVVQKNVTPYDERFFGYGWNKISQIMELKAQGYQFLVLPNVFIVHKPHKQTKDNGKFLHSKIYHNCLEKFKSIFLEDINEKYGNRSTIEVR